VLVRLGGKSFYIDKKMEMGYHDYSVPVQPSVVLRAISSVAKST